VAAQQIDRKAAVEEFRLGGADAPAPFDFPAEPHVVVNATGTAFVRVSTDGAVHVLSADGEFLRTIGRKGNGPGEFQVAAEHGLLGDTLWVRNWPTPRIARFLVDGTHIGTESTRFQLPRRFSAPVGITGYLQRGAAYLEVRENTLGVDERVDLPVLVGDRSLTRYDTIGVVRNPSGMFLKNIGTFAYAPFPFSPLISFAADGSGIAMAEWSADAPGEVLIRSLGPDAAARWTRTFEWQAQRIPRGVRDSLIEAGEAMARGPADAARRAGEAIPTSMRGLVEEGLYVPYYYPPVYRILAGVDCTVWVERSQGLRRGLWTGLDGKAGSTLFEVQMPAGLNVQHISERGAWGTVKDGLGITYLVRVRFVDS
jgi:hypothetical protein